MKRIVVLLILLPIASIVMSTITLFMAFTEADPAIAQDTRSLSKTSWREEQ